MSRNAKSALPRKLSKLQEDENPRRIFPFMYWCALNDLSPDLGRRIINGRTDIPPPKVTQMSERRIGIRADHNAEWQDARIRAEPKTPPRRPRKLVAAE